MTIKWTLIWVIVTLILVSCAPPSNNTQINQITSLTNTVAVSTESATGGWDSHELVKPSSPFEHSNRSADYQRMILDLSKINSYVDLRWKTTLKVDNLVDDVGESSTGIVFTGKTSDGETRALVLVYQYGTWSLGYQADGDKPDFSHWVNFEDLVAPQQQFTLTLSTGGRNLSLENESGFHYQETLSESIFDDVKSIMAEVQVGPNTAVQISSLSLSQAHQKQEATSTPTQLKPAIPVNTPSPTLSPTPTMTPAPISISSAIKQGAFGEITRFNKGKILLGMYSPNGKMVALMTFQGIFVYRASDWNELIHIPAVAAINCAVFSADSSRFAVGDSNGVVTFWDTETWEEKREFELNYGSIQEININPDMTTFVTISGSGNDTSLALWKMDDGSRVISFKSADLRVSDYYNDLCYSADGERIMVPEGMHVSEYGAKDLRYIGKATYMGPYALSPSTEWMATYRMKELYFFNMVTRERIHVHEVDGWFDSHTIEMMFVDDSRLLILRDDMNFLIDLNTSDIKTPNSADLAEMKTKNPSVGLVINQEKIKSLGFFEFGNMLNITGDGRHLILDNGVLDMQNMSMLDITQNENFNWNNHIILEDGNIALTSIEKIKSSEKSYTFTFTKLSKDDFFIKSYDVVNLELESSPDKVALSPDGSMFAVGLDNGTLCIYKIDKDDEPVCIKQAHKFYTGFAGQSSYQDILFNSHSTQVITFGDDNKICQWNVDELAMINCFIGTGNVLPDEQYFAFLDSTDENHKITFQSLIENNESYTFEKVGDARVLDIALTQDGGYLLSSGWDGIQAFPLEAPETSVKYPIYSASLRMVLSPDGNNIYTWGAGGIISVWGGK